MADTPVCKDHDFESCDENDYSLEEHIPSDDEGNDIIEKKDDSGDKKDNNDQDEDLDDDYWTDTESEDEDDNQNERKDNRNEETNESKDDKIDDAENEINDESEGPVIQTYGRHHQRHQGHGRSHSSHGHSSRGHSSRGHGHHNARGGSRRSHGPPRHGLHMSRVFMPSNRTVSITVPDDLRNWKCGRPTKLITLNPHGKTGRKEYKLISKVVELTKRNHSSGHFNRYHFVQIQKIVNGCFWKRYRRRQEEIHAEAHFVNERMLFHGTNKVKELLQTGFDERYANINGMFGAGIYFAKHSSKSNQYAFGLNNPCPRHKDANCDKCERQMLLCRVTMGKVKKATGATKIAHAPPGHHSVEGIATPGGLKFPEYIVYRGEQVYAEYLITYKIVK